MPYHQPIKIEGLDDDSLLEKVQKILQENRKVKTATEAMILLLALGGTLSLAAIAPNVLGAISRLRRERQMRKREKYRKLWRSFYDLKKQRWVEFVREEENFLVYKVNEKGKEKIKKFVFEKLQPELPKKWDKKWRLVIFDIPEKRRRERAALRKKLIEIGFYQCQKSAWIYPFDCIHEIEFIKDFLKIGPYVKTFTITDMEDGKVLYHFRHLLKDYL